jgi:hypothetical protein
LGGCGGGFVAYHFGRIFPPGLGEFSISWIGLLQKLVHWVDFNMVWLNGSREHVDFPETVGDG